MSSVSEVRTDVSGLFIADCHWGLKAPRHRKETDWLGVQKEYILQLRYIYQKYPSTIERGGPPIFICGDLFDNWNSSAELINFLIQELEGMEIYAINGNHDTPNHSNLYLPNSAYWTLVEAKTIKHLTPGTYFDVNYMAVRPFPYGFDIKPPDKASSLCLKVALVHDYIWIKGHGHKDAPESKRYNNILEKLKGYDVAFFGDNHSPWMVQKDNDCSIVNCGTFMRRHKNEVDHKPCVHVLHANGIVTREYLDTSKDQFQDPDSKAEEVSQNLKVDLTEFRQELSTLNPKEIGFAKQVILWLEKNNISPEVATIMMDALPK